MSRKPPERAYQSNYSRNHATPWDFERRARKARKLLAVLDDFFRGDLAGRRALDVGCSLGVIAAALAERCATVVGVDIDPGAIEHARVQRAGPNLRFEVQDGLELQFEDASFEVVVCNQVYEHAPDPPRLLAEIHRVLAPGGVCYFGADNRLRLVEPHHKLPLLSVLPRPLAHRVVRALGRGERFHERHLTLWQLRRLVTAFRMIDYTARVIDDPVRFGAQDVVAPGSLSQRLARLVVRHAYWACPTYLWLLVKE